MSTGRSRQQSDYSTGFVNGAPTGMAVVDTAAGTGWNGNAGFTSPN